MLPAFVIFSKILSTLIRVNSHKHQKPFKIQSQVNNTLRESKYQMDIKSNSYKISIDLKIYYQLSVFVNFTLFCAPKVSSEKTCRVKYFVFEDPQIFCYHHAFLLFITLLWYLHENDTIPNFYIFYA